MGVRNAFYNNVASQFYQSCGTGTLWLRNYMLPRANGNQSEGVLAYCNSGTEAYAGADGTYSGVTINTINSATYPFTNYGPTTHHPVASLKARRART